MSAFHSQTAGHKYTTFAAPLVPLQTHAAPTENLREAPRFPVGDDPLRETPLQSVRRGECRERGIVVVLLRHQLQLFRLLVFRSGGFRSAQRKLRARIPAETLQALSLWQFAIPQLECFCRERQRKVRLAISPNSRRTSCSDCDTR